MSTINVLSPKATAKQLGSELKEYKTTGTVSNPVTPPKSSNKSTSTSSKTISSNSGGTGTLGTTTTPATVSTPTETTNQPIDYLNPQKMLENQGLIPPKPPTTETIAQTSGLNTTENTTEEEWNQAVQNYLTTPAGQKYQEKYETGLKKYLTTIYPIKKTIPSDILQQITVPSEYKSATREYKRYAYESYLGVDTTQSMKNLTNKLLQNYEYASTQPIWETTTQPTLWETMQGVKPTTITVTFSVLKANEPALYLTKTKEGWMPKMDVVRWRSEWEQNIGLGATIAERTAEIPLEMFDIDYYFAENKKKYLAEKLYSTHKSVTSGSLIGPWINIQAPAYENFILPAAGGYALGKIFTGVKLAGGFKMASTGLKLGYTSGVIITGVGVGVTGYQFATQGVKPVDIAKFGTQMGVGFLGAVGGTSSAITSFTNKGGTLPVVTPKPVKSSIFAKTMEKIGGMPDIFDIKKGITSSEFYSNVLKYRMGYRPGKEFLEIPRGPAVRTNVGGIEGYVQQYKYVPSGKRIWMSTSERLAYYNRINQGGKIDISFPGFKETGPSVGRITGVSELEFFSEIPKGRTYLSFTFEKNVGKLPGELLGGKETKGIGGMVRGEGIVQIKPEIVSVINKSEINPFSRKWGGYDQMLSDIKSGYIRELPGKPSIKGLVESGMTPEEFANFLQNKPFNLKTYISKTPADKLRYYGKVYFTENTRQPRIKLASNLTKNEAVAFIKSFGKKIENLPTEKYLGSYVPDQKYMGIPTKKEILTHELVHVTGFVEEYPTRWMSGETNFFTITQNPELYFSPISEKQPVGVLLKTGEVYPGWKGKTTSIISEKPTWNLNQSLKAKLSRFIKGEQATQSLSQKLDTTNILRILRGTEIIKNPTVSRYSTISIPSESYTGSIILGVSLSEYTHLRFEPETTKTRIQPTIKTPITNIKPKIIMNMGTIENTELGIKSGIDVTTEFNTKPDIRYKIEYEPGFDFGYKTETITPIKPKPPKAATTPISPPFLPGIRLPQGRGSRGQEFNLFGEKKRKRGVKVFNPIKELKKMRFKI